MVTPDSAVNAADFNATLLDHHESVPHVKEKSEMGSVTTTENPFTAAYKENISSVICSIEAQSSTAGGEDIIEMNTATFNDAQSSQNSHQHLHVDLQNDNATTESDYFEASQS